MSLIEKMIAQLPDMTAKARAAHLNNVKVALAKNPDDPGARRLLEAHEALDETIPTTSGVDVTGLLSWEKNRAGTSTFRAFHDGKVVGRIFKGANHSVLHKDVYELEILGTKVPGRFHHILDAREAGERAFTSRREPDGE